MTTVPSILSITIKTSVPGNQTLYYKPNMSNPANTETKVYFNPLVQLKDSVIQKVPQDMRTKQFFNKGYFQSLVNLHGNQPPITLTDAERKGYIDDNIETTLRTLFPTYGLLYITNKPYSIATVEWQRGEWRIGTKMYGPNYQMPKSVAPPKAVKGGRSRKKNKNNKQNKTKKHLSPNNVCYITVYMELQKGTSISAKQMKKLKCRQKWNAVRKSYSSLTGTQYVIPPAYDTDEPTTDNANNSNANNTNNNATNNNP